LAFEPSVRFSTWDSAIWQNIVEGNEYFLPERLNPWDLVIDVGAHIGAFSYAAWKRGSHNVWSYEPYPSNFELLRENTKMLGGVFIAQLAVWRSDFPQSLYAAEVLPDPVNTGGISFFETEGIHALSVGLDNIINEREVRFLKLDCEGAEFPILLTSKQLGKVEEISLEFHEMASGRGDDPYTEIPSVAKLKGYDKFVIEDVVAKLTGEGFVMEHFHRHGSEATSRLGYLHMKRSVQNG
jgi:FkbM family methyltransferase